MSADWHDVLSSMPEEMWRAFQPAETLAPGRGPWGEVAGTAAGSGRRVLLRFRAFIPGEPQGSVTATAIRARRVANVRGETLAKVHAVAETAAGLALVVDRPDGQTLPRWLGSHAPSLMQASLTVADGVAGVAALHGAGVIHSAVHPEALRVDGEGRGRLHGAVTLPGERSSWLEPRYRAPEIEAGFTPTPAADVFPLGRMLEDVLAAAAGPPRLVSRLRAVADRAASPREARYPDAIALLKDLLQALEEEVPPFPPGASDPEKMSAVAERSPPFRGGRSAHSLGNLRPPPEPIQETPNSPAKEGDSERRPPHLHEIPPTPASDGPTFPYRAPPLQGKIREISPLRLPSHSSAKEAAHSSSLLLPPRDHRNPPPAPLQRQVVPALRGTPQGTRWMSVGRPAVGESPALLFDSLPGQAPAFDQATATLRRAELSRRTLFALLWGERLRGQEGFRVWMVGEGEDLPPGDGGRALVRGRIEDARKGRDIRRGDGQVLSPVGILVVLGDGSEASPEPLKPPLPLEVLLHAGAGEGARRYGFFMEERSTHSWRVLPGAQALTSGREGRSETWLPVPVSAMQRTAKMAPPSCPQVLIVRRRDPSPSRRRPLLLPWIVLLTSLLVLGAAVASSQRPRSISEPEFAAHMDVREGAPFWRTPQGVAPASEVLLTLAPGPDYDAVHWPLHAYRLLLERKGYSPMGTYAVEVEPGLWGFRVDGKDPLWSAGDSPVEATLFHLSSQRVWSRELPFPQPKPAPTMPSSPSVSNSRSLQQLVLKGKYLAQGGPLAISRRDQGRAFGESIWVMGAPHGEISLEIGAGSQRCDGGTLSHPGGGADLTSKVMEAAAACGRILAAEGDRGILRVRMSLTEVTAPLVFADDWFDPRTRQDISRREGQLISRIRLRGLFLSKEIQVSVAGRAVDRAVLSLVRPGWVDEDVTPAVQRLVRDAMADGADLMAPPVVPVELRVGKTTSSIRLVRQDLTDPEKVLKEQQWRLLCVAMEQERGAEVFVDEWGKEPARPACRSPEDFRRVTPARIRVGVKVPRVLPLSVDVAIPQGHAAALECAMDGEEEVRCSPRIAVVTGTAWGRRVASLLQGMP